MKMTIGTAILLLLFACGQVLAQGQDSQPADRDLQVLATMLVGGYDNANQSYFDSRGSHEIRHRRIHTTIIATDSANEFLMSSYWDNDPEVRATEYQLSLSVDYDVGAVRMQVTTTGEGKVCDLYWRREAAQFRASPKDACENAPIKQIVLGQKELWVDFQHVENGDFKLHRVRNFECYADIPGVGGGRDEAYERYDGFKIHDQGGAVWFDTDDGRKLGISLFLVDWPINNYDGIFTRDSFVIYVSEEIDGERKEHGYAFTVPEVDRLGINLKWMLASCFQESNKYATPYM